MSSAPQAVFHYSAYDMHVESEIELSDLHASEPAAAELPKLRIVRSNINRPDSGALPMSFRSTGGEQVLSWAAVGAFRIAGPESIDVDANTDVPDSLVALPLLGAVMATLLHRRGHMVLHASAVEVGGVAVALLGDKGAGKSTSAAALVTAGHRLISDDIVALDGSGPSLRVLPGGSRLRLWPDSGQRLGAVGLTSLGRLHDQIDKGRYAAPTAAQHPVPIERLYLLGRAASPGVRQVDSADALAALLRHGYVARFGYAGYGDHLPAYFRQASELVRQGRVRALEVPLGLDRLDEIAPLVQSDLRNA